MKRNLFIPKTALAFLMALFSVWGWGQTNPSTGTLPFTFNGNATLPSNLSIHRFGTTASSIPTTRTTSEGNGDLASTTTNNSGGYINEGNDGISLLASGSQAAGAVVVEFSTIGKENVKVDWVSWTKLDQTNYTCSLALQYRIGDSGNWINSDLPNSSIYSTGTVGRSNGVAYTQNLPATVSNKSIVQIRWIYYQSSGSSGSRDRLGIDEISITSTDIATGPNITTSTASLSNLTYILGNGPSTSQSFTLIGSNLTNNVDIITGNNNYEFSTANTGTYNTALSLTPNSGSVNQQVYVRLKAGLALGNYDTSGDAVIIGSLGATDKTVTLSGSVTAPVPTINATPSALSNFTYIQGSGPSAEQSFSVNGINLSTDITVTAPTNYEISTVSGSGFANSLTLSQTSGTVNATTIYARLKSGLTAAAYNGNITVTSTGASNVNLSVIGNVSVANDLCTNAETLVAGTTANGSLAGSTYSAPFSSLNTSGNDVWYKFTAANSGSHTFTVTGFTGDIDIELFGGSNCPTNTTFLADAATSNSSEIITFNFTSGTTYYLRVISYNVATNTSSFTVNLLAPTACITPSEATALVLTPTSSSVAGSFTASSPAASGYFVVRSLASTLSASPVNGTVYNVGDAFGGGTVVKYSSGTTFSATGLSQSTNYYFFVYSYNNQCIGEPFYSTSALQGTTTTLSGPCVSEDFSSNTTPNGWIDTFTGITYPGYADMSVTNGSITTLSLANPSQLNFQLSRTGNSSAKTLNVQISTTSQTSGFTTIASYNHSNTTSNGDTQITLDLSAYSTNTNVYVRFEKTSSTTSPWRIDNVQVFCATSVLSTTWDGATWSNNTPTSATNVTLTGNYTTSVATPAFTAKNITIQNGGVLEITDGNTINAADVTVENGGNLIQRGNGTLSYSGAFKVNKTGATAIDKYTFWASPVVSQNLNNIYATNPAFITQYDTPTNTFVNSPSATSSIIGKGYSIKNPSANAPVAFTGIPNNGPLTLALDNSSFGYNLVGNPYPSDLNLGAFFTANSARITSTFYFWDTNSSGLNNNPGYAVFNAANGANPTWIAAPNTSSATPAGDVAKIGQGFIVKATANTPLTFDNTMRGAGTATFFNKNNSSNEGKYWLKLSSSYNTNNTIAVTYFGAASNAYDIYDSKALGLGVDALYSTADAEKIVIQGRGAFIVSDIVPLASKHATTANFTIALTQKEGVFDNGQAIYLHDKVLGTYTNLQNTSYNFTANAGEVTDRFEVVYQLGTLSTSEAQKGSFEIYRDGNDFYARNNKNIDKIEIFDASGRKIQDLNTASQLVKIQLDSKGFYIIKAKSAGKEYTKKITK